MKTNMKQAVSIKKKSLTGFILSILTGGLVFAALLTSCGGTVTGDSISMDIVSQNMPTASSLNWESEQNLVLRCATCTVDSRTLTAETSKAKGMEAQSLIFMQPADETGVTIAIVPITGKEYEYDMAQAQYLTVSQASAASIMDTYGMPFIDWQNGACSSSEQFPCCE